MNAPETLREVLACIGLCAIVFCLVVRCSEAQEAPPNPRSEARAMVLTEAEGAALATPHDAVRCFQERVHGSTHICITEAEWLRRQQEVAKQ